MTVLASRSFRLPLNSQTLGRAYSQMKNGSLIKAISVLIFLAVLTTTVAIITQVVLGYRGFKRVNGRSQLIALAEGCQQSYTNSRFGEALGGSLQIFFILTLASQLWSAAALFLVVCTVYCRRPIEQREETRIEQLQSCHYQRSEAADRYHPRIAEIVTLYVLLALLILSSYVPFNFHLQLILQARRSSCKIDYNFAEVLALAVLSLIVMVAALVAFLILLVLAHRFRQRMKMLELENGSESIHKQVDRIIRELPESERRFYEEQRGRNQQMLREREGHGQKRGSEKEEMASGGAKGARGSESRRSQIRIEQVPQVRSVIYKVDPELMLQSVNVNPQG